MHNFWVYWLSLYTFRTVFLSIIRSSRLYTQHQVYVIQVSWLLASEQSTNLYDIYLVLCVQSWTPDDGQKDRPKHVEWFRVCKSVHHHTFNWITQPDAVVSQVYYLTFIYSSTCFGHPHAHHQELNNCSSSLWFYCWSMLIAVLLVVVGSTMTNSTATSTHQW